MPVPITTENHLRGLMIGNCFSKSLSLVWKARGIRGFGARVLVAHDGVKFLTIFLQPRESFTSPLDSAAFSSRKSALDGCSPQSGPFELVAPPSGVGALRTSGDVG